LFLFGSNLSALPCGPRLVGKHPGRHDEGPYSIGTVNAGIGLPVPEHLLYGSDQSGRSNNVVVKLSSAMQSEERAISLLLLPSQTCEKATIQVRKTYYGRNVATVRGGGYADRCRHFTGYHEEERFHFEISAHLHPKDDVLFLPAKERWAMSAATTPARSLRTASTRRVPRYKLTVPLDVTVLRSGVPDNIPGRTLEIGEGGMGVVVASQLLLGESVRVEFLLPHMSKPVRATAVVRYQRELSFGLQFLRLPDEQQSIIRYWTRHEADISFVAQKPHDADSSLGIEIGNPASLPLFERSEGSKLGMGFWRGVAFAVLIIVVTAVMGWWRWEQGWRQLEAQVPANETLMVKPQLKVPADTMQRRIIHEVAPEYPEAARRAAVQGTVVLDAIVSAEGAVTQVQVVSGPETLSLAAIDAVRWWRYEPYILNGQPAMVETTVSVNFRLAN
jgi:TonB family protein